MEMANKVAVVTGGSGGIGRAMGKAFLAEGAEAVVLADLDANAVEGVACEFGSDGQVCDVTIEAQVQALVDKTLTRYGRIDLFCSNASASQTGLLMMRIKCNINIMNILVVCISVLMKALLIVEIIMLDSNKK